MERHGAVSTSQLRIDYLPIAALKPYERNARTHSPDQVKQIAASMQAFGWTNPILIDETDGIIAGHGRVMAARDLAIAEVPVIRLAGLSEEQRRALILADNKIALNAGWDEQLLAAELGGLGDLQPLVGFSDAELLALFNRGNEGLTDPDELPEAPPAIVQPGEVWQLGAHRLVCGDCTRPEVVEQALAGARPHLMVTDPPYGVEYDPDWRNRTNFKANRAVGLVNNDDRVDWREAWAFFPGDVAYVWHADRHASAVQSSLEVGGFEIRCQIIWSKQNQVFSRGDYHWKHEPCWYAVRKGRSGKWAGDRKQTTVWEIANHNPMGGNRDEKQTGHSTQKPVECMRRPIENNSAAGDAVYDPFVGSGTTIIAAEITGRKCHAIELEPGYCDVAIERWQNYTGEKAKRV